MESARTPSEIERQAARFKILAEASHAFAEVALDYQGLLSVVARRAADIVGDCSIVNLLSDDDAWLLPLALWTDDPGLAEAYQAMLETAPARATDGTAGRVITENAPALVPLVDPEKMAESTRLEWRDVVRRMNVHSLLLVPMRARGKPIGSLTLYRNRPGHPYDEADKSLLQDLADRAALAVENARLHSNLERRVAERTADLERARAEAEDANRTKSRFIANISHEVRTPLNAIIGFSDLLRRGTVGTLTPRQSECMEHVAVSGRHLLRLINDLLDLSTLEAGHIEIAVAPTALLPIVARVRDALSTAAEEKQIAINLAIPDDLPAFLVDPLRLEQILFNLASNAIKFTRAGGRITISSKSENHEGVISVSDTGIGIAPENLERLFRPFEQIRDERNPVVEGTGLGLAITRDLVELHKGSIRVASEIDRGTTFTMRLPLHDEKSR